MFNRGSESITQLVPAREIKKKIGFVTLCNILFYYVVRSCNQLPADCNCDDPKLYDCVIDDNTAEKMRWFREFVLYDRDVIYPEYIVTYQRVL